MPHSHPLTHPSSMPHSHPIPRRMARVLSSELRDRLQRRAFTVTVGNRESSHAQYLANDAREVLKLLETLRGNSAGGGFS